MLEQPRSLLIQQGMEIDSHFLYYYSSDENKNTRDIQLAHKFTRSNVSFNTPVSCDEMLQQSR
jgi:hypothetical protein